MPRVVEGSMTAAFILSQHDAGVRRLAASIERPGAHAWLEMIAADEAFATVGISQLTTSRRHGTHALMAQALDDGYRLDGVMPWVTGAEMADVIVTSPSRRWPPATDCSADRSAWPRRQAAVSPRRAPGVLHVGSDLRKRPRGRLLPPRRPFRRCDVSLRLGDDRRLGNLRARPRPGPRRALRARSRGAPPH